MDEFTIIMHSNGYFKAINSTSASPSRLDVRRRPMAASRPALVRVHQLTWVACS